MEMDLSRISTLRVAQVNQELNPSRFRARNNFGWKPLPSEDYGIFLAFCKKFKLCMKCRDIGFNSSHVCRTPKDAFQMIPSDIYRSFCTAMEQCGICPKCWDAVIVCQCNKNATAYVRSLFPNF